jgi:hypothetical protein
VQLLEKSQKSDVPPIRRQTSVPVRHQYIFVDFQRTSCYNIATTPATHYANSYYSAAEIPLQIGAAGAFKGEFVLDCGGCYYLITYDTPQDGVILYYMKALEKRRGDAFAVYPSLEFAKKDDRKSYAWVLGFFMPFFGGDSVFTMQDLQESFG